MYSREEYKSALRSFEDLVAINDASFPGSTALAIKAFRIGAYLCEQELCRPEGEWLPKGYIHLPTTRAEAEMMHLISENWLKNNVTSESNSDVS